MLLSGCSFFWRSCLREITASSYRRLPASVVRPSGRSKSRRIATSIMSSSIATPKHDEKCIFCKVIQGTIPCHKVYETDLSLAFLDIAPVSEGHTQVIPKYHAVTIADLPDEYLRDILPIAKRIALSTGVKDFNILQNNGRIAFQHVDHVHFHVVPKPNEEEGIIFDLDINFKQRHPSQEELKKVAEKMRGNL